jgi:hypothetical protein
MIDILHCKEGRILFFEEIFGRRHCCKLNATSLEQLGDYFRLWLTATANEQERDVATLFKVILLTQIFYCEESGRRFYLYSKLNDHSIWKEKNRWLDVVDFAINTKIEEDLETTKLQRSATKSKRKGLYRLLSNLSRRKDAV